MESVTMMNESTFEFSNITSSDNVTTDTPPYVDSNVSTVEPIMTVEQRQFAKYVLFYFILPVIAVVGIVGNTLSLSLLRVTRTGLAFNTYLTALTMADTVLLCLALARCIVLMVTQYPDTRNPRLATYGEYYLSLVFGIWFQRLSSALISIISIERFVAVAFPLKVKTLGLETKPLRAVFCVIIGTFLIQIPTFVLFEVKRTGDSATNETLYTVGLRTTSELTEKARHVFLIINAVVNMFVPMIIVATSTVAIVICIKFHVTSRRGRRLDAKDASDRDTMTLTLVALAAIFTLCYIPAFAIYILPSIDEAFYRREILFISVAVDVNVVCVCVNSASDFLIYFLASRNFRLLFAKRYLPCLHLGRFRSSPGASISRYDGQVTCEGTTPSATLSSAGPDTTSVLTNISGSVEM